MRCCTIVALVIALGSAAVAEQPIEYTVHLEAPQTQTVDVSLRVRGVDGPTLELAMPTWRPGRYRVLDPAGGIRTIRAATGDGIPLPIEKTSKSTWALRTGGASDVVVRYQVYANELGSRTRHVDDTHAFLSGESIFLYVPARRSDPLLVTVETPEGWGVASGLEQVGTDPVVLAAPDYDVLVDSPLEVGLHDRLEFEVEGVPHEIVLWSDCTYDGDRLVEDFRLIVEEQVAIFGRMPYERYVFMIHAGAGMGGGTEHLNSTIMQTSCASLEGSFDPDRSYRRFLGLVSHEMFHTWNVKQFRPAGISPYDYQRENYTTLLWVAEGTTSYYDDLSLVRAGLTKPNRYLEGLADAIEGLRDRPGATLQSLEESSFDAWIKFTQPSPDSLNTTVSFYSKGALVSLLLDMEIRARSDGDASLDDLMRRLFERFPAGSPGFRPEDLEAMAAELAGGPLDAFFERAVRGTGPLDFATSLGVVGLELSVEPRGSDDDEEDEPDASGDGAAVGEDAPPSAEEDEPAEPGVRPYLGLDLSDRDGRTVVRRVRSDGPAWMAGVIADDEIVSMDGRRLRAGDLDDRLERLEPGTTVTLHVMRRDRLRMIDVTLASRPDIELKLQRVDDPTDAQRKAYESWIGHPWPEDAPAEGG